MTASVIQSLKRKKRKFTIFKQEGSTENFSLKWEDANSSENPGGGTPGHHASDLALIVVTGHQDKNKDLRTLYY